MATLLSYEQRLLAHFIVQSSEERARILAAARLDPKTSGPLIQAYEQSLKY
jgi:hypothetical protein